VVVYANVTASISAAAGGVTKAASLTIKSHLIKAVTLSPTTVTGGSPSAGKVTLMAPAGLGGVVVTLVSDSPEASVPPFVTVPAGSLEAGFTVMTLSVAARLNAGITASIGASKWMGTLTINP
jgi:hypothetical protein